MVKEEKRGGKMSWEVIGVIGKEGKELRSRKGGREEGQEGNSERG